MVHADAAVELVVEAGLEVGFVVVAPELHAVHAQVRPLRAGVVRVLGVDGRERDEGAAVARPGDHLRQTRERDVAGERRPGADGAGQHGDGVERRPPIPPGTLECPGGIDLELHQPLHAVERVGEDPLDPLLRAVEVGEDRERGARGLREEHGRAARPEQPPLDLGDLEVRVDRVVDLDEVTLRP